MKYYLGAMMCLVAFVGCKNDENEVAPVNFPAEQSLQLEVGATASFSFDAPADGWELTSAQPVWCRLSYENQKNLPSVVGNAGQVTVTVIATDDMSSYLQESESALTLRVGSQQQVIGKVIRNRINTTLTLLQGEEEKAVGSTLSMTNEGTLVIEVASNFGTPVVKHSDWLDVEADGTGYYTFSLAEGTVARYPINDGFISFAVKDAPDREFRYPVSFPGMDPKKVKVTGYQFTPVGQTETYTIPAFGWEVTADGQTLTYVRANGDIVTVDKTINVTVDALNDDVVFAWFDEDHFVKVDGSEYFHIAQNKNEVSVTVDALPAPLESRSVSIYVFPTARWEEVAALTIEEDGEGAYTSNGLFSFKQSIEAVGFSVEYYDWSTWKMCELPVEKNTEADYRDLVLEYAPSVSPDNIFLIKTGDIPTNSIGNKSITVNSLYQMEEWINSTDDALNYVYVNAFSGEDLSSQNGYAIDCGINVAGKWSFDIGFAGSNIDPLLLIIYNPADHNKVLKVLIILMDKNS